MRDPIKTKEKNHRRRYTYVKSRESATTMVNMGTKLGFLWRENRTSTVCTAKRMYTPLKNFTTRRSMVKDARTVTRRVTKKISARRNKNMTRKEKGEILISLKIYIMTSSYLIMMHLREKIKQSTRKLRKYLLLTQDIRHIW